MPGTIDFYFDFISPFSYFAYQELPEVAARHGLTLVHHPVELNDLKRGNNNTGPSNRDQPLKRRYNQQEFSRWSKRYRVTFQRPAAFDPESRLNKGAFLAIDRGRIHDYVAAAWRRTWGSGGSLAGEGTLRHVARDLGWEAEALLAFVVSDEALRRYRATTEAAHERGVFGVPTMIVGEEMFWGNDHVRLLEEHIVELAGASA